MRRRHQQGYVYKKGKSWFVRYYDDVMEADGSIVHKLVARRLGAVSEYPRKRDAVLLAEEFLTPLNTGEVQAAGTMSIARFATTIYLPHVAEQCRPSTLNGYRDIWRHYIEPRIGRMRLRDFKTWNGEQLMQEIARHHDLSRTTLKHIKAFVSGMFKHAKRQGFISGVNPMQDVSIPAGREPEETYACSLEEVTQMLAVLPPKIAVIVAVAAFTGLRRGEVRGLLWEDYDGTEIRVRHSVWRSFTTEPKTRKSKAPVPVITLLARMLEQHRRACGNPTSGLMFQSQRGTALNLAEVACHVIRPALEKAGLKWHGWHSFRRGLATNLYRLGVPDKTIQAILRHSNVATTMNSYIKTVSEDATKAMQDLEQVLCTKYAPKSEPTEAYVM